MSLNPQSPLPLYRQLAERIQSDITEGIYSVDSRIPSENSLATRYCIGRPTVRQATDLLVRKGQLVRRRGSGTFVCEPRPSIDLFSLAGTSAGLADGLAGSDLDVTLTVTDGPRIIEQDYSSDEAIDVDSGTASSPKKIYLQRDAVVDSQVILREEFYFDAGVFNGLEAHDLQGVSLSKLIRDSFYLEPKTARQSFAAALADNDEAATFKVAPGSPLLRVMRSLFFSDNAAELSVQITCLTDRFEFSQTLYPTVSTATLSSG